MQSPGCRICHTKLPTSPELVFQRMPGMAQNFPDKDHLADDHGTDLALYECKTCGLLQLISPPVPYYKEVIRAAAYSPEMRTFRLKQLSDWINQFDLHGKRLLEIGCGKGEYLTLLANVGATAIGLEYAGASVAFCRENNLNVIQGFLSDPEQLLESGPFDGFITLNFMEHWPQPISTLRAISNNISPGGIGLVEVPNLDMIIQQGLFSEFIADHLSYFTINSLSFALQYAGFEIIGKKTIWHDYILSIIVRKRQPADLSPLIRKQEKISIQLNAYIDQHPPKSVAIWGAGHQALAILALSGIAPQIRYVVDSAPFKQGRFTPGSHLPVVSPEHLHADPVSAIIIMAAGYSDEVAQLIKDKYKLDIPVGILRPQGLELL